jgi:glycosyltransferase involved in cell wall biosynthesis
MKILIFNWEDIKNPLAGGAEVHLHEVFSRIAKFGHEVTLYCCAFPGAPEEEDLNGIHIIRRGGRHLFNYRVPFAYFLRFQRTDVDVVIDDMNKIPFYTPLFVREGIVGVTHHLFGTSIFRETNVLFASYVYLTERLAVLLYRRTRVPFVVGSPSTYRELLAEGFRPDDVTLIHYAVDHGLYHRTGIPKSPTPLVGYFGRLKKYKSIDHLLRAVPSILRRVPDVRVLIVGEGDDRPRLENTVRELGLERHVEFTGYVDERRKVDLLQQMWVKVTTSTKEGWGLTVLEANACGTPVVSSNVPGLRDAVKDNETGLLYAYGAIDELAGKVVQVLTDVSLRERLTENALRWAKEFDWDTAARRTFDIIKEAAGR